jgi:16S rRNA (cytidine1402-2'-O)-methyltransferase
MSGTLFVVATPIGNLEDLSPRARQTLAEVDLIAAEDTRHTGRLLSHLGLKTRQFALHEHNEARAAQTLIEQLKDGKSVALVSDAGTPLVSDPGYRLLQAAHASGIAVSPVPGPSAVTAALSVSGLPTDRFGFEGFPPAKSAARRKWLQARAADNRTLLFFEAVHRIAATLTDMVEVFGADRQAFLGRELTKLHEQCRRASLGELLDEVASGAIVSKGEFVIAIHGAEDTPTSSIDADRLLAELAQVLPPKKAAMIAARVTGEKRNALYQRLLGIKSEGDA